MHLTSPMKVFIIQLDSSIQADFGPFLEAQGFDLTRHSPDASTTVLLGNESTPDVFLLDGCIDDDQITHLCRTIRSHQLHWATPILVVAAKESAKGYSAFIDAGCDDVLTHPTKPDSLL